MRYKKYETLPYEVRLMLSKEPFMQKCIIGSDECTSKIDWHHGLIYGGKRVHQWWAIVPLCSFHHDIADRPDVRAKVVETIRRRGGNNLKKYENIKPLR